jgi:hypothetical protein
LLHFDARAAKRAQRLEAAEKRRVKRGGGGGGGGGEALLSGVRRLAKDAFALDIQLLELLDGMRVVCLAVPPALVRGTARALRRKFASTLCLAPSMATAPASATVALQRPKLKLFAASRHGAGAADPLAGPRDEGALAIEAEGRRDRQAHRVMLRVTAWGACFAALCEPLPRPAQDTLPRGPSSNRK